ncbi:MAG: acetylxylan esterase [Flammeovirgaceae bacterium]|nr:acetylxylan esterase [Flammeovirgaceae bacterium]
MKFLQTLLFVLTISMSLCFAQTNSAGMLCQGRYYEEDEAADILKKLMQTIENKEDWEKRAEVIRQGILDGVGLKQITYDKTLKTIRHSWRKHKGYSVENIAFESLPGVFVTGALYKPLEIKKNIPVILSTHGHWSKEGDYGRFRKDAQTRFANFAKMGTMVLAIDMVGYGETREIGWEHKHKEALKLQIWNCLRAVDFLLKEEFADPERVAVTGASGGGTQTILLAALDKRITVSVPTVMVSAHFFGGCVCESGMPIHKSENHQTNNVEIAATFAPKPQLLISDGDDWTKNNPEVEYPFLQYIYGLYGKKELVENVHLPEEKHDYGTSKRQAAYKFLAKHLGLNISKLTLRDGSIHEKDIVIESEDQLKIFDGDHHYPESVVKTNNEIDWKL